jgi:Asp/Glu/hydantoin racemase
MGLATARARQSCPVPLFNIDEPMAREAVRLGTRLGILATVPTSAPATRRLLEREAAAIGKTIQIETVVNEPAFAALLAGDRPAHNRIVHDEMDRLAQRVDVIVLGQISLAQIQHRPGVPVLQVGHSGFAHARELLARVAPRDRTVSPALANAAC